MTGHGSENKVPYVKTRLFSVATHVSNRSADCHSKQVPSVPSPSENLLTQLLNSLYKDLKPEHICLGTRTVTIKQQSVSDQVAAVIEAPQRSSNRVAYEAKWSILSDGASQI